MATRMQQRRGTATMWTNANPILGVAEIGYETDTNKFKIGDGTNRWADLSYFVDLDTMIEGAPGLLNSLDEIAAAIGDDPAFFTTIATGLASKAPLASPTFTGTVSLPNNTITQSMMSDDSVGTNEIGGSAVTTAKIADSAVTNAKLAGSIAQSKITDLVSDLAAKASNTDLSNHEADTTNIHGIADTSALATKTYADNAASTAVAAVIDSAPGALDTLNELAAALSDDANYATTVTNALALKAPLASPTFTGTVSGVTKAHVGLGNADNTSDANKPVSTATQTALDAKLDSSLAASTYETIDNVALKAPIANPTFTGTVSGVTKAMVGLGSVDNTSDANKPVSTATQTALDLKATIANPTFTGNPTAPTQTVGNDSTRIATTAFVKAAIQDIASLNLVLDGGGV